MKWLKMEAKMKKNKKRKFKFKGILIIITLIIIIAIVLFVFLKPKKNNTNNVVEVEVIDSIDNFDYQLNSKSNFDMPSGNKYKLWLTPLIPVSVLIFIYASLCVITVFASKL